MKVALVFLAVASTAFAQLGYSSRYNNIDVDAILNNQRVLKSYINCFIDKGPCTAEGREGKKYLPEIYDTNCAKCSEEQKAIVKKTMKAFISKRKDDWALIVQKYDPEGKHEASFVDWVNE